MITLTLGVSIGATGWRLSSGTARSRRTGGCTPGTRECSRRRHPARFSLAVLVLSVTPSVHIAAIRIVKIITCLSLVSGLPNALRDSIETLIPLASSTTQPRPPWMPA